MKKILIFNILAAAMLAVSGYATEPGPAISQLESFQGALNSTPYLTMPDSVPQLTLPGIGLGSQNNSTEDCSMQYGVEVCIAPNWPSCWDNGDVEPCIDHVIPQQPYCYENETPLWLSVGNSERWHQGCYDGGLAITEKARGGKTGMRFEKRGLALLLGGRKIYFNGGRGGEKTVTASGAEKMSLQDLIANDPCGGLMACYNPIDPALLESILAAYSNSTDQDYLGLPGQAQAAAVQADPASRRY